MQQVQIPAAATHSNEAIEISNMLSQGSNRSTCHDTNGMLTSILHPPSSSDANMTMRMASNMSDSSIQCLSSHMPGTAIKELENYVAGTNLPAVSSQRSEESAGSPHELMMQRWHRLLETMLPPHDLHDASAEQVQTSFFQKRQFAPEFSDSSYQAMLEKEYAIGDYLSLKDST